MTPETDIIEIDADDNVRVVDADENGLVEYQSAGLATRTARASGLTYILLPIAFLTVTLLGGLRIGAADGSFIFLKPALICLVFATVMMVLLFRSRLVDAGGWFSDGFSTLKNAANGAVLLTLFAASAQMFNSLLPEQGLPFLVVGFCFAWTLWNDLFAEFDARKLIRSLGALFAIAFVTKYLILANLTAPESSGWLQRIFENPAKEAFTWLLDLPRYSSATGYIQFFAAGIYLLGLYLTPSSTNNENI